MKNLFITINLFVCFAFTRAEAQVNPANTALLQTIVTQLSTLNSNASTQTGYQGILKNLENQGLSLSTDTFDEIKKIQKNLKMVNSIISTGKDVQNIISTVSNISLLYLQFNLEVQNHPVITDYDKLLAKTMGQLLIDETISESEDHIKLISNDILKLSDFERLTLLKKISDVLNKKYALLNSLHKLIINEADKRYKEQKIIIDFKE